MAGESRSEFVRQVIGMKLLDLAQRARPDHGVMKNGALAAAVAVEVVDKL